MTTINTTTTQENVSIVRLFIVCALLMLTSTVSFAQSRTNGVESSISTQVSVSKATITTDEVVASTSMDFAVWFMGSKKTSNNTTNGTFSKKQLINSGINTNSVLIRSFLKKVSTQENGVA